MKRIFVLLLLASALGHAQSALVLPDPDRLLIESDFTLTDGRMLVSDTPCQISSAWAVDRILVSVICQNNAFKQFGIQKINDMIVFANDKVRSTVAHSQGYQPSEIKMSYNPELRSWSMTNLFTLEDSSGTVIKNLLSLDFDANGKFLNMKRIF